MKTIKKDGYEIIINETDDTFVKINNRIYHKGKINIKTALLTGLSILSSIVIGAIIVKFMFP